MVPDFINYGVITMDNRILDILNELQAGQKRLEGKVGSIENKVESVQKDITEVKADVKGLYKYIDEVDARNATNHLIQKKSIEDIKETLNFVKHKENQNEEQLFKIKEHLTVVK
jgi:chromosome segregation ATPase